MATDADELNPTHVPWSAAGSLLSYTSCHRCRLAVGWPTSGSQSARHGVEEALVQAGRRDAKIVNQRMTAQVLWLQ